MAYSSVFIHMVWSTKHRQPCLDPELRSSIYPYIGTLVKELNGHIEIINAVADHVHMLVRLPTTLSIATLAQKAKGNTATWINKRAHQRVVQWQVKYGAFSVSPSQLSPVREYIRTQEEHHRKESFQDEMRRLLKEAGISYDERFIWE